MIATKANSPGAQKHQTNEETGDVNVSVNIVVCWDKKQAVRFADNAMG
jgi:hypothetical protein